MNNIAQIFGEYNNTEIRWNQNPEYPVWVAADVGKALELKSNGYELARNLDEDEKGTITIHTLGGNQEMVGVTEAGLYRLIFKSRKEGAKGFQRWVFHDVLPSLRKTGTYTKPKEGLSSIDILEQYVIQTNQMFQLFKEQQLEQARQAKEIEETKVIANEALTNANEAKKEVVQVRNELSKLKEFAVAQPPGLDQDQADLINKAFQNLGAVLAESGVAKPQCYKEPWKDLGLTMRNSTLNYDLNARISNARKKYEADLEIWNDNIKKWENTPKPRGKKPVKPIKPSRISILIRDNKLSEGFKAAQQVVSAQLAKLSI